jgi:hypothetical protein
MLGLAPFSIRTSTSCYAPRGGKETPIPPSRGDGSTKLGSTGGLTNLGSLVSHVRALEGRWISS